MEREGRGTRNGACVSGPGQKRVRTEGGWRAGAAHGIAGRERDQAPVYTVEATDLLLLVCPVPGRVPAVGGRGSAIPAFRGSSEPLPGPGRDGPGKGVDSERTVT